MSRISAFILLTTAIILGILSGIAEASTWALGFIPFIRQIVPYATADALLIFGVTSIIALLYPRPVIGEIIPTPPFFGSLISFVRVIMISTAVFLVFIQILVGTLLPFVIKIILAFIGSISFWIMLLTFIALVIWIARRR